LTLVQDQQLADHGLVPARYLLTALVVAMLLSTSATVAIEIAAYAMFAWYPSLRARVWRVLKQPASIALAVFLASVVVAVFYGLAPWKDALGQLSGWRKALLFFLAAAVFDEEDAKRSLAAIYVLVCFCAVVLSFITHFGQIQIFRHIGNGITIHNYAVQSFAFSIAAGLAALALIDQSRFATTPLLRHWTFALLAVVAFVADILFVLQGRSGYVILIVIAVTLAVMLGGHSRRTRLVVVTCVVAVALAGLAASSVARQRLGQAIAEMRAVNSSPELTSAGVRIVFWQNAAGIIAKHPVFGVGTAGFKEAYREQVQGVSGWQAELTGDPHNQFLKVWAEQGIFGLAALVAFIVLVLRSDGLHPYREMAIGILLAVTASSFANSHFSTFTEGRLTFFWIGALMALPLGMTAPTPFSGANREPTRDPT